jgi:hypothetical protein
LPAAKSGSSAAQSAVSTIDPVVEQIGHASTRMAASDMALSAPAGIAAGFCRDALKKQTAGSAAKRRSGD